MDDFFTKLGTEWESVKCLNLETKSIDKEYTPDLIGDYQEQEANEGEGKWSVNGRVYSPCGTTLSKLPAGVYEAAQRMDGSLFLVRKTVKTDKLLRFPDSNIGDILKHVEHFWSVKDKYESEGGFLYKRGILVHGPAGGGKTALMMLLMKDLIDKGGIVLLGDYPRLDSKALVMIRDVEPETPIITIYEDIDEIIRYYGDKALTELLDGESNVDNVLYLATTNYPERLPPRIINRPSRFDIIHYVGMPNAASRKMFLQEKTNLSPSELETWVAKTDKLSISHLKELIISVKILGHSLDESIVKLKNMKRPPSSAQYE